MHATMLPRDDDNQHMTFEGKRVVLLHSEKRHLPRMGCHRCRHPALDHRRGRHLDPDGVRPDLPGMVRRARHGRRHVSRHPQTHLSRVRKTNHVRTMPLR